MWIDQTFLDTKCENRLYKVGKKYLWSNAVQHRYSMVVLRFSFTFLVRKKYTSCSNVKMKDELFLHAHVSFYSYRICESLVGCSYYLLEWSVKVAICFVHRIFLLSGMYMHDLPWQPWLLLATSRARWPIALCSSSGTQHPSCETTG